MRSSFTLLLFMLAFSGISSAQVKTYTLQQCIDTALKQNIQLRETQLTSKLNEINYNQAKANQYPAFSFTDGQAFSFGYSTDPTTNQTSQQNISSNNIAINGSMTLYNGFQLKNTIKQTKYFYDAGNFDLQKMKNDLTLDVIAGYLQVLYAYKALEIARNQVSTDMTQVDKTQKYVDVGKLAEGNLFQIQSQLATDKASVVSAENQVQLTKVTLMQLMNKPVVDDFEVDSTGTREPSVENITSAADIYKTSESIMPEIKSADLVTKADELDIEIAKALALPRLTLGGTVKTAYSSSRNLYSTTSTLEDIGYLQNTPTEQVVGLVPVTMKRSYPFFRQLGDNFGEGISLNLTIPIFTNYQAKNGIAKARITLQNSQLAEQSVKDQLRKLVEQAYTDLTAAVKNYSAAQEALKSEERAYTDLEKKYNLGLVTATDFLIEKGNYEKTQLSLIQTKFNYIFKSKIVDFYLGKPLK